MLFNRSKFDLFNLRFISQILLFLLLITGDINYVVCQETEATMESVSIPDTEPDLQERLLTTSTSISKKEKELKALEQQIKNSKDPDYLKQAEQEVLEINDIIKGLKNEFVNLATGGARLYPESKKPEEMFDWREDLEAIARPMLDELKKITHHPRKIEELETDISYWSLREKELANAVNNLTDTLSQVTNPKLKKDIQNLLNTGKSRYESAQERLALLNGDLDSLRREGNPIWSSLGQTARTVLTSMLVHFIAALSAALVVYYIIFLLGKLPLTLFGRHRPKQYIFIDKLINLIKRILGIILATFVYIMMLYSLNEWIILGLSLLLIAVVLIGLRNTLPQYLVEFRTLLNMGSVRQNERLIYAGLPWKISKLDVYTHLHNPLLDGHLRVPLTEISRLTSRPYHDDEPWFPTSPGDIVILEDEVIGKVIMQTPDIVQIDYGGSVYSYSTGQFLDRRPRNLSKNGFTVFEVFGVDYSHQAGIIDRIMPLFKQELVTAFSSSPFQQSNTFMDVEFDKANASSLDFRVIASFTSEAAADYFRIKRFIQKSCVEAANKHGWVIPFQQITVHTS